MADVRLEGVTKSFGGEPAVDAVSFTVPAGKLVALLGPSGCGKSTTLRLIAGLEEPTGGRILIGGRDVTDAEPSARGISMVFQSYALFPHLSVAENIVFGLRVRRTPDADIKARLARVADMLGLTALLDRKPSQLSGGQQQRVALGRAIVAETPVCLMDEPLSNLDAQLRGDMRREIRELQQRLGMTMVYVTHDQVEAMTMADVVVLMRAGKIEQLGPPDALYDRPETSFTARFIGAPPMNVIPYRLLADHATWLNSNSREAGQTTAIGVRPERIRLAESGVPAIVASVEYLGSESLIDARSGDTTILVRVPGRAPVKPGSNVHLAWSEADTHRFDQSSGRRIN